VSYFRYSLYCDMTGRLVNRSYGRKELNIGTARVSDNFRIRRRKSPLLVSRVVSPKKGRVPISSLYAMHTRSWEGEGPACFCGALESEPAENRRKTSLLHRARPDAQEEGESIAPPSAGQ